MLLTLEEIFSKDCIMPIEILNACILKKKKFWAIILYIKMVKKLGCKMVKVSHMGNGVLETVSVTEVIIVKDLVVPV